MYKRGLHALVANHRASVEGGMLRVMCETCADAPHPDHSWRLTLSGESPARGELDDTAYVGIEPGLPGAAGDPAELARYTTPIATA